MDNLHNNQDIKHPNYILDPSTTQYEDEVTDKVTDKVSIGNHSAQRKLPITPEPTTPVSPNIEFSNISDDDELENYSIVELNEKGKDKQDIVNIDNGIDIDNVNDIDNVIDIDKNIDLVYDLYDKLKTLTMGTLYIESNWLLLVNKVLTMVTSPDLKETRNMTIDERLDLVYKLVIMYLEMNTSASVNLLNMARDIVPLILSQWAQSYSSNKKDHKMVAKKQRMMQKKLVTKSVAVVAEDTITPSRIEELLIERIEMMFTRGKFPNFKTLQDALPEIIVMCIKVVDKYSHLSVIEKRNLIVQTIIYLLDNKATVWFKLSVEETQRVELFADSLPLLVETTTSLINGELPDNLNLNDIIPLGKACFKYLGGIFKSCHC